MSRCHVEGAGGNPEVSPFWFSDAFGDLSAVRVGALPEQEGGSWGKHGFPHATEPKASEVAAA